MLLLETKNTVGSAGVLPPPRLIELTGLSYFPCCPCAGVTLGCPSLLSLLYGGPIGNSLPIHYPPPPELHAAFFFFASDASFVIICHRSKGTEEKGVARHLDARKSAPGESKGTRESLVAEVASMPCMAFGLQRSVSTAIGSPKHQEHGKRAEKKRNSTVQPTPKVGPGIIWR